MKARKDLPMSKVVGKLNARNAGESNNQKGGLEMDNEKTMGGTTETQNVLRALGKSPLRNARYQHMKEHLQKEGGFILCNRGLKGTENQTRAQIEQAIDDVMSLGYAKVGGTDYDGTIFIEYIDRDKSRQSTKTKEM